MSRKYVLDDDSENFRIKTSGAMSKKKRFDDEQKRDRRSNKKRPPQRAESFRTFS